MQQLYKTRGRPKGRWWLVRVVAGMALATAGVAAISAAWVLKVLERGPAVGIPPWLGRMTVPLGLLLLIPGVCMLAWGVNGFLRSAIRTVAPYRKGSFWKDLYRKRHLERGPRITAIGGGTGLSVLLRGLKEYSSNITAIVTVTDDGGSSGILKGDFDMLPPGDIRNCLVALADIEGSMQELFDYRFNKGSGLAGHSLGNLLLAAMSEMRGDFYGAVREAEKVLAIRGRVLPSTLTKVTLAARMTDGTVIEGETRISESQQRIESVFLAPRKCRPLREAVDAVLNADAVVLGPGSLYTSVIPNLLVRGIRDALERTHAPVFYVCNVMTQHGETEGYDTADHLDAILLHAGPDTVNYIVVNNEEVPETLRRKYQEEGSFPVELNLEKLQQRGIPVVEGSLVDESDLVRHDSAKLAQLIIDKISSSNGRVEVKLPVSAGSKLHGST